MMAEEEAYIPPDESEITELNNILSLGDLNASLSKLKEISNQCSHKKSKIPPTDASRKLLTHLLVNSKLQKYDTIVELNVARALACAETREQIMEEDGVTLVAKLIVNGKDDKELLHAVFPALHAFVVGIKEGKALVAKLGAVEVIMNKLETEQDPVYLAPTIHVMAGLLASSNLKEPFAAANGIETITNILKTHKESEEVVQKCMVVLRNSSVGDIKEKVFQHQGIELIMDSLRTFPLNIGVQDEGLMALHNMTSGNYEYRHKIMHSGIFDILATGFTNHPKSEGCIRCLRQLTVGLKDEETKFLDNFNFVGALLKCVEASGVEEQTKNYAFDALAFLAHFPDLQEKFLSNEAIKRLLSLSTSDIYPLCVSLMAEDNFCEDFLENGGIARAIKDIKQGTLLAKFYAFSVLAHLVMDDTRSEETKAELNKHDILPLITKTAQGLTAEEADELSAIVSSVTQAKKLSLFDTIPRLLFVHRERVGTMVQHYVPRCMKAFTVAVQVGARCWHVKSVAQHSFSKNARFEAPRSFATNDETTIYNPTPLVMWQNHLIAFDEFYMYWINPESLKIEKKIEVEDKCKEVVDMGMTAAVVWKDALFTTSYSGHLFKWIPNSNEFKCVLAAEAYTSNILVWGDYLVTIGNTYSVQLWSHDLNKVSETRLNYRSWCGAVLSKELTQETKDPVNASGSFLALGAADRKIHIMDFVEGELVEVENVRNEACRYPVHAIEVIPGTAVAFGHSVGNLGLLTKNGVINVAAHKSEVKRLVLWQSKNIIISCGKCSDIILWNYQGGKKLCTIDSYYKHMNSIVIHNDKLYYQDITGDIHCVEVNDDGTKVISHKKRGLRSQTNVPEESYKVYGKEPELVPEDVMAEAQDDSDSDVSAEEEEEEEEEDEDEDDSSSD